MTRVGIMHRSIELGQQELESTISENQFGMPCSFEDFPLQFFSGFSSSVFQKNTRLFVFRETNILSESL